GRVRARARRKRRGNQPGDALRLCRDHQRHAVRQLCAEPRGGRAAIDNACGAAGRPDRGQGRQDRPDADEDGDRPGAARPRSARGRLVLDQHPGQPRRPGARRPALACVQARHQEERPRPDARLPCRGPCRAHSLLQAARRRQGGLGQYRHLRLPRREDADQDQLPVQGLGPCRPARDRDRARARPGAATRARRRAGAAGPVLQGPADERRPRSGARVPGTAAGAGPVARRRGL
ncbi:MAG: Inositol-1-phosphate synthase, partial [uncultured Sphingomonadaceae bacterium]